MARFTTAGGSGDGALGPQGPAGNNGADALWNYVGEYSGGAAYAVGDIVTYDGQLWYRYNANGGNVGDTPSPGLWNLLAAKGADGADASGGVVYLGNYISGNGYIANIAVVRGSDNNLYIAKSSGGLGDPVGNTAEWDIFSDNTSGNADIADFVFTNVDASNSSMTVTGDKEITIESGADSDLNVRAGDQLWLTAGNDVILQADDTIQIRSLDGVEILSNYVDMGDAEHRWQFTQGAELILPGGGIIFNAPESSSDGGLLSTLILVPDGTNETNQYIAIDPTGPNHIHIRAGGPIDESTAELILGGERNKVAVSDSYKTIFISTAAIIENVFVNAHEANSEDLIVPETSDILIGDNIVIAGINHPVTYFSPDPNNTGFSIVRATGVTFTAGESYTFVREEPYENQWSFSPTGVFSGPAMGGVKVPALANQADGDDLLIYATGADVSVQANDGDISLSSQYINLNANDDATISSSGGDHDWVFNSNGVLYGPAEDSHIEVAGIRGENGHPTMFIGPDSIVLDGNNGEFLNDPTNPSNQIATIGNINDTVSTGMVRYSPTFAATGLAFTGSGATHPTYNSYYVKAGKMVTFAIEVDCATVTNFGTGQYKLQLPFTPAIGFNHFSGWANVDTAVNPDVTNGHIILNVDHAGVTDVLDLHYLKQAGGANSGIIEGLFLQETPVTLTTSSKIYVNGTYISQ
jgi:hypothetical protein